MSEDQRSREELLKENDALRARLARIEVGDAATLAVEGAAPGDEVAYASLLESAADPHFVIRPETGEILAANAAATAHYGYGREELVTMHCRDLWAHPAEADVLRTRWLADPGVAGRAVQVPSRPHRRKDGAVFPVDVQAWPIRWNGRPAMLASARDITLRVRGEAVVARSQAMLARTERLAHVGSWEWDLASDTVIWSEEVFRIFGRTIADGPPSIRDYPSHYHPDDISRLKLALDTALRDGTPYELELRAIRGDGDVRVCLARGHAEVGPDGTATTLFGSFQDVTDVRRSEEALRESDERYRRLFLGASDGILILSARGDLLDVNESFARMHGYTVDELRSLNLRELDTPHIVTDLASKLRRVVAGESLSFETEHYQKDGTAFPLEVSANRIFIGDQPHILAFHRDLRERKRAEEARARLEDELRQAQKMESVGRLAGGVAHDFNNMLGVILGHTELAIEQAGRSGALRDDLEEIRTAATRSADLTRQLLAFARRQTVAPVIVDMNSIVGGMTKMLRRLIGENIQLNWLPQSDLWRVKVDPTQIGQILANLCVNARDAIAGVGRLTIETSNATLDREYAAAHVGVDPGDYVRLAVRDDGRGMDAEVMEHVFEPFFTTKGVGLGTGLGLATVYGIVKQNHGFIDLESQVGTGTTFTVYLPRHLPGADVAVAAVGVAQAPQHGHETILLVEDERAILDLERRMLERLGYTVIAASTPGDALRMALSHAGSLHLLITDVVMPDMNGRDLARNLKSELPSLKLLFVSGYTADVVADHGVLDDGVHFLHKPFSGERLAAKVREALDSEPSPP